MALRRTWTITTVVAVFFVAWIGADCLINNLGVTDWWRNRIVALRRFLLPSRPSAHPHDTGDSPPHLIVRYPGLKLPAVESAETDAVSGGDSVIGISVAGQHRAYVIQAMTFPVTAVINDLVGETPVTVTYHTADGTARVLTDTKRSEALDVMCDGIVEGRLLLAIGGHAYPQNTPILPLADLEFSRLTWDEWKGLHPATTVFTGPGVRGMPAGAVHLVVRVPGISRPSVEPVSSTQLADDTEVIGVLVGRRSRAYVQSMMRTPATHVVNDVLGSAAVTVTYCNITDCIRVLTEAARTEPLEVSVYGLVQGELALEIDGEIFRQRASDLPLADLEFERTSWGKWKREHPTGDVYVGGASDHPSSAD